MATSSSELLSIFDFDSDLSDPPSDLDDMETSIRDGLEQMDLDGLSLKRKSTATSNSEDSSMIDLSNDHTSQPNRAKRQRLSYPSTVRIEDFPREILQRIAVELDNARDFSTFALLCQKLADAVMPWNSIVWKWRFLSEYDYPRLDVEIEGIAETKGIADTEGIEETKGTKELEAYCFAYKMRTLTLKRFVAFHDPDDKRIPVQLEGLRLMVVETYFQPVKHLPPPTVSLNLARFSDMKSEWIATFLSCPFYPTKPPSVYGDIHHLFQALQLVFSHLLLSPASAMAYKVPTSRQKYSLVQVYNWNQPVETLYRRFAGQFVLDTWELLHIRNFWHRHLIDYPPGEVKVDATRQSDHIFEYTYAKMAKKLWAVGITAKPWDKFLEDGLPKEISLVWYGHYSCLHKWPVNERELGEMQSDAEDWDSVDPMRLDLSTSIDNATNAATDDAAEAATGGFWPSCFSNIPVFQATIPQSGPRAFIKGLAQFVDDKTDSLAALVATRRPNVHLPETILYDSKLPKYHSYLSLRVRGIIHPIAAQPEPEPDPENPGEDESIPGWNRIVMVLYKPTTVYLIRVLEYAEQNYGGAFGPALNNVITAHLTDEEIDATYQMHLEKKLLANPAWCGGIERVKIEQMEENYQPHKYMRWDDIAYAYAYEGVMLPGGKIVMGRWWRCGGLGGGQGWEVRADGEAAQPNDYRHLERGPFLFWAA